MFFAATLFFCNQAEATVTLEVCYEDGMLQNRSVVVLVADGGDEVFLSPSDASAVGTVLSEGQTFGASDDHILAVFQAEGGDHWQGSAGVLATVAALDYATLGIEEGTPLVIYAFPNIMQPGASIALGDEVIEYRNTEVGGSGGDIPFTAPPNSGVYTLAAITPALGGTFDPTDPSNSEEFESFSAGLPGNGSDPDGTGNSRDTAIDLTSTSGAVVGSLSQGDLDYYSVQVNGLSQVTAYTTGITDTLGFLYAPDGSALNTPVEDDDAGEFLNFRSSGIVHSAGEVTVGVLGKESITAGDYEVFLEVQPLSGYRSDLTIGRGATNQIGDDIYTTSGAGQAVSQKLKKVKLGRFYFEGQNDGGLLDDLTFTGTKGNRKFRVSYYKTSDGIENVTASMAAAGYLQNIDPLQAVGFRVDTKGSRLVKKKGRGTLNLSIRANSEEGGLDLGKAEVVVKARKKKKKR